MGIKAGVKSDIPRSESHDADHAHMQHALRLARRAESEGEVPVGAVVVRGDEVIGRGYNQTIAQRDPSAHAEVLAIRAAAQAIGNHRLGDVTLYVTLEPCIMCAGAMLHARIARLVYGARDKKYGAAGSALNLVESPFLNHRGRVTAGVAGAQCGEMLKAFFAARRSNSQPN